VGKSYLACALGQKACREGHYVIYRRASRLFDELAQARADGSHFQLLRRLAKTAVLVIDDFGLEVLTAAQRKDFLEVIEDRYGTSSTVITSQLEPTRDEGRSRRHDRRAGCRAGSSGPSLRAAAEGRGPRAGGPAANERANQATE